LILELQMHDLVGVVLPLLEVEDLRQVSQVQLLLNFRTAKCMT